MTNKTGSGGYVSTYMLVIPVGEAANQYDIEEALRDAGITAYVKSLQDEDGN